MQHFFIHCSIHKKCCNIHPVVLSIIFPSICSFILTAIVDLLIQAAIFHPARDIVNILIIASSKKLLIVINTDSLTGHKVNIHDTVKNG